MSNNRLKILRKVVGKTQKEIAKVVNITQNAYSYWENGKVNIDSESLRRLADFYGVSLDFLSGRSFKTTREVSSWTQEQQAEYYTSDDNKKLYLEYKWGSPIFLEDTQGDELRDKKILRLDGVRAPENNAFLTERETILINAYRSQPQMQTAVDRLLGIADDSVAYYEAARSKDNRAPRITRKSKEEWDIIQNAPETDDPLL